MEEERGQRDKERMQKSMRDGGGLAWTLVTKVEMKWKNS
jgi:hypothetical protein